MKKKAAAKKVALARNQKVNAKKPKATARKPHAFLSHSVPLRKMQKKIFFEPAVYYVCAGNCLGHVNAEHHTKGHTHCRIIVCSHYGKPLEKMHYCRSCKTHFSPKGPKHVCMAR
ncbi:MAG: hypothetical protein WC408_04330 [Candidatus Micrarchaeia archaeon]|jgi:hypothetical protein